MKCDNCGAEVPKTYPYDTGTRMGTMQVCCAHCVFNPLGCQCHRHKFDQPEAQPYYGEPDDSLLVPLKSR